MGKNGKRGRRTKHFGKPRMPEALEDDQSYGVITKYLGGHTKRMNVTIHQKGGLRELVCSLKGSLRPRKCKQRAVKGSYCIVEDTGAKEGVVVMIMDGNDVSQIPVSAYDDLQRVGDTEATDDVGFQATGQADDLWAMPGFSDDDSDDESDDGIAFEDPAAVHVAAQARKIDEDDIDAI